MWWNNNAYPEAGYDISNVRLYQLADLKAGDYYFGASYPSDEANEDLYIYASDKLLNTSEIPTQSIAYEKVKAAPADGSFRGIYFTLEEDTPVYLGWQADFTYCSTNNLRASGVKLLKAGSSVPDAIDERLLTEDDHQVAVYSLQGIRLNSLPQHGLYLIRTNGKTYKVFRK